MQKIIFIEMEKTFRALKLNLPILILFVLAACQENNTREKAATATKLAEAVSAKEATPDAPDKEVAIYIEETDTIKASEKDINRYLKHFPEMTGEPYPLHPDIAYALIESKEAHKDEFGSEAGIDYFFLLYTYFLKQKNGIQEHENQRQRLLALFQLINSLNAHIMHGGSYFGHQGDRIHGYAEYAVYSAINNDFYQKEYDISPQKELFLNSLKQMVLDTEQSEVDNHEYRSARREKLMGIVSEIDGLISNYFFLEKAREFQYNYY